MILHFIRRDFQSFKMYWLFLGLSSAAMLWFRPTPNVLPTLFGICLIFAIMPTQQIAGVKFRSQHIMSRNYLLSLPIKRKLNFLYVVCRMQIFLVPVMVLLFFLPLLVAAKREAMAGFWAANWHLGLIVPLGGLWFSGQQLSLMLASESISSHYTSGQRFWAWFIAVATYVAEFSILAVLAVFSMIGLDLAVHLPRWVAVPGVLAVAFIRIGFARKKWMET